MNVIYILMISLILSSGANVDQAGCAGNIELKPSVWKTFNGISIQRIDSETVYFFKGWMTIDADGAPNAYNPDPLYGLDDLKNAGEDGNWKGIATDENGKPFIQDADDPCPGYYVSTTSLSEPDILIDEGDPSKYVNANEIPYIVLPVDEYLDLETEIGCLAMVVNLRNNKISPAIFADRGPSTWKGEGSINLANNLELEIKYSEDAIYKDKRIIGGGCDSVEPEIIYIVFPKSGSGKPLSVDEIEKTAFVLFDNWGGLNKLGKCFPELDISKLSMSK